MPGAGVLGGGGHWLPAGARAPGLALAPGTWPWVVEGAESPEATGWPVVLVLVASSGDPGPVLRGWLHLGGRLAPGSHLRPSGGAGGQSVSVSEGCSGRCLRL